MSGENMSGRCPERNVRIAYDLNHQRADGLETSISSNVRIEYEIIFTFSKPRSSAVAEIPRDSSCH